MELNYVKRVKPQGTFVAEWQKKNGSFKGFEGVMAFIVKLWQSNAGNDMVRIQDIENHNQYNLPAGIFLGYMDDHKDSKLVLFDGELWTLNPEVAFSYDPIDGISEG